MTTPRRAVDVMPVFVSRDTAARLCEVSVDTFDTWVAQGYVPGPAINRGQTRRWHWPSVEARLAGLAEDAQRYDPYMTGVRNAKGPHRAAP